MNTVHKGDIAEYSVIAALLRKGWSVSKPIGNNQRYDLILDKGDGLLYKVQVKLAEWHNTHIIVYANNKGSYVKQKNPFFFMKNYNGQVDFIASYCLQNNKVYLIDLKSNTNVNSYSLRFEQSKNFQSKSIRLARDYEL